jgi:radical SAM-linked protein
LRFIGHHDLARTMERLLRRAGVRLSMSEGFHPHARMSFPLALAVGIAADEEVVEFDLAEEVDIARLTEQLALHAPPGLSFSSVDLVPPGQKKAAVECIEFGLPLPEQRRDAARAKAEEFMATAAWPITRAGRRAPLDIRGSVLELTVDEAGLRMRLAVSHEGMPRPREVLQALGLDDLEQQGYYLTRTAVTLRDEPKEHQEL